MVATEIENVEEVSAIEDTAAVTTTVVERDTTRAMGTKTHAANEDTSHLATTSVCWVGFLAFFSFLLSCQGKIGDHVAPPSSLLSTLVRLDLIALGNSRFQQQCTISVSDHNTLFKGNIRNIPFGLIYFGNFEIQSNTGLGLTFRNGLHQRGCLLGRGEMVVVFFSFVTCYRLVSMYVH